MNYWLVKQEAETYAWQTFVKDGSTDWTGVRNYTARNNLQEMKVGDLVLYYHSGDEKQIVGIAKVTKPAFPDPTTDEKGWVAVELSPVKPFTKPVTLATVKQDERFKNLMLVRQARLSVMPVSKEEFQALLALGQTKI